MISLALYHQTRVAALMVSVRDFFSASFADVDCAAALSGVRTGVASSDELSRPFRFAP
jgi:hypothetical protein